MSKIIALIIIITIIALFFLKKKSGRTISIQINNQAYKLEVADNITSRAKGLSGRDSLCPHCGMIFIYQKEGIYPFWMKNTHFPLDIIWLDKNGKIVDIKQGQPKNLSILKNKTPAQYIIELPVDSATLSVNDTINLPHEIN